MTLYLFVAWQQHGRSLYLLSNLSCSGVTLQSRSQSLCLPVKFTYQKEGLLSDVTSMKTQLYIVAVGHYLHAVGASETLHVKQ